MKKGEKRGPLLPDFLSKPSSDTYTAIDVDTPNRSRSPRSASIVNVQRGNRTGRVLPALARQPWDDFDGVNISIHGIRPEDVEV
jgi:hypothetical protein